jgi:glucosamine-6-phosphate deaminase
MGGTIDRLIEQGHTVDVVFLTSGNLGVGDDAAERFAEVLKELANAQSAENWEAPVRYAGQLLGDLAAKGPFGQDNTALRSIKSLVRRSEARHALRNCNLGEEHIHFLELPFYESGRYRRFKPGGNDVSALCGILTKLEPHQVYMTGSASDPSSVAGVCYRLFQTAMAQTAKEAWQDECWTWLYRSGEKPFASYEIDMAVPMSPGQLKSKLTAVSQYTQEEESTGEGERAVAKYYDQLGLADYEAIEAFRRWAG